MHLWRYIGWVLGIREDLLPRDFADQQEFFLASTRMMGDNCDSCGENVAKVFTTIPAAISRKTYGLVPEWVIEGGSFQLLSLFAGDEYLSGVYVHAPDVKRR